MVVIVGFGGGGLPGLADWLLVGRGPGLVDGLIGSAQAGLIGGVFTGLGWVLSGGEQVEPKERLYRLPDLNSNADNPISAPRAAKRLALAVKGPENQPERPA